MEPTWTETLHGTSIFISSKRHIESQIKKLLRYGTLISEGDAHISVEQIKRNGAERVAVRLECKIDLRKDLESRDYNGVNCWLAENRRSQ